MQTFGIKFFCPEHANLFFLLDPVADLSNAQAKITRLEAVIHDYKSEVRNISSLMAQLRNSRDEINELNLKVESLELQALHSQKENDARLHEKEVCCVLWFFSK